MARLSLCLLGMPSVVGCFDSPPQYSEPDRVPPVIDADQVVPPVTKIYIPDGEVANFDVAFRADDAGQKIAACFVRDIGLGTQTQVDSKTAAPDPRPFADQIEPRHVTITWTWMSQGVPAGCHTVTAVVADQNDISGRCDVSVDRPSARVTWFVVLGNLPDQKIDCFGDKLSGVSNQ